MNRVTDILRQASLARDQRRYLDALAMYEEAIGSDVAQADVVSACAMMEFAQSVVAPTPDDARRKKAISLMEQAVRIDSVRPDLLCSLAQMWGLVEDLDYAKAAACYRQSLELEPCYADSLFGLARLYGTPDNVVPLDEAIRCAERAAAVRPTRSVWILLKQLYTHANRRDEALAAERKALLEWFEYQPHRY